MPTPPEERISCPYNYDLILRSNPLVPLIKHLLIASHTLSWFNRLRGQSALSSIKSGSITGGWNIPHTPSSGRRCLNLGCGKANYTGYINLDISPQSNLDIIADGRNLPFPANTFDDILCTDVIEHLDASDGQQLLHEIERVLAPGGRLLLVTPCLDGIWRVYRHQAASYDQVIQHLLGDQRDHRYLYTSKLLRQTIQLAGLQVRRIVEGWGPIWAHIVVLGEKP